MTTTQNTAKSGPTFRVTVTNADGTTSEGTSSETDALCTLRTAARRGCRTEATRNGGAVIVRDIWGGGVRRKHTVTIEPIAPTGRITDTNRLDLELIAGRGGSRMQGDRIKAGYLNSIPPVASRRLIDRGLVTVADGGVVTVSLAARLAMLAQDHHTETREPRGYVHPADVGRIDAGSNKGGGRSGLVYDGSSAASCSCRRWSYPAEDRDSARRKALGHRQEAAAALLRTLDGAA